MKTTTIAWKDSDLSLTRGLLSAFCGLTAALAFWVAGFNWHQRTEFLQMQAQFKQLDDASGRGVDTETSVRAVTPPQQVAADLAESLGGSWETVGDSGSMAPVLNSGDLAVLLPADIQNIEVGDIVVYRAPGSQDSAGNPVRVVHRVIAKEFCVSANKAPSLKGTSECTVLRTQGDANKAADPVEIRVGDLEGLIVARIDAQSGLIQSLLRNKAPSR